MRHQKATVHELARLPGLSGLPGETLGRLADLVERAALAPGEEVACRADADGRAERVYAVVSGMVSAHHAGGGRSMLGPGRWFVEAPGRLKAVTPVVVVSCARGAFEELGGTAG